ncbi:MAG: FkbM family methyltransferase [Solirubrobacteraceae bacterium]
MSTRDQGVARQFVLSGAYEAGPMNAAVEVLSRVGGDPFATHDRTFLDIGANIGTAIVQAVRHHGAGGGVAFEPDPDNVMLLRHNLIANGLHDRVRVVASALSDRCCDVALERSADNHGDHRVRIAAVPHGDAFGESGRPVLTVPSITFDSAVDEGIVDLDRVGLASIDTQGHEAHVLAGATTLCASGVPVMLEYWPYGLRAAGGHERLKELLTESFEHYVDLGQPFDRGRIALRPATEIGELDDRLGDIGWANVLLLSR